MFLSLLTIICRPGDKLHVKHVKPREIVQKRAIRRGYVGVLFLGFNTGM